MFLKTPIVMPNKPWLIERNMNKNKPIQIAAWFFSRLLSRILNAVPLRIRIGERVISHRYLLHSGETLSRDKSRILGYSGLLLGRGGGLVISLDKGLFRAEATIRFFMINLK